MQNRFIGCLLGLAIGDALGAPVEFLNAEEIKQRYGRVTDYLGGDGDTVGVVCGALAGAYYGKEAIPQRWLEPLSGRMRLRSWRWIYIS